MMRWIFVVGLIIFVVSVPLFAQDGIPDNCENATAPLYDPALFVRYEPQNQRVVMVSWHTGDVIRELKTNIDASFFSVRGWSPSCQFVAIAIGTLDNSTTFVYDITNGAQVAAFENAIGKPHPMTWGWNDYLVVETRLGAYLWHISTPESRLLTTSYDTLTGRNFSRLRWDGEHHLLTVDFAVGGRTTYDLFTGTETIAQAVNTVPALDTVIVGNKAYQCGNTWQNVSLVGLTLRYDFQSQTIYLAVADNSHPNVSAVVLDTHILARSVIGHDFSPDCRYLVATIQHYDTDQFDTVVYDVVDGQRVGAFTDAQQIPYPYSWNPVANTLLVQTRTGAYLWRIPSDERIQLTDQSITALVGQSAITNFHQQSWLKNESRLLVVTIENPTVVTEFDGESGQILATYPSQQDQIIDFDVRNDAYVVIYTRNAVSHRHTAVTAWQRTPYQQVTVDSLPKNSRPQLTYPNVFVGASIDGDSGFSDQYGLSNDCQYDLAYDAPTNALTVTDASNQQPIITFNQTSNRFIGRISWSPNCRYMFASVSANELNVPYDTATVDDSYGPYVIVLDMLTGEELQRFDNRVSWAGGSEFQFRKWFSPDGQYAIVRVQSGHYLWHISDNTRSLLTYFYPDNFTNIRKYPVIYWDYARGQVLLSGSNHILGFDLLTGEQRSEIRGQSYSIDPTGQWLISCNLCFTNLNTGELIQVTTDPYYSFSERSAISPDKRYIVSVKAGIRVWDLTQMPSRLKDRTPTYLWDGTIDRMQTVKFVDPVTIEVSSWGEISYWNVETGEQVAWGQ